MPLAVNPGMKLFAKGAVKCIVQLLVLVLQKHCLCVQSMIVAVAAVLTVIPAVV